MELYFSSLRGPGRPTTHSQILFGPYFEMFHVTTMSMFRQWLVHGLCVMHTRDLTTRQSVHVSTSFLHIRFGTPSIVINLLGLTPFNCVIHLHNRIQCWWSIGVLEIKRCLNFCRLRWKSYCRIRNMWDSVFFGPRNMLRKPAAYS